MNFISTHPIVCAVIFIFSFELIFDKWIELFLGIALLYIVLKILGLTNPIKTLIKSSYERIFNKSKTSDDFINITETRDNGTMEGTYTFRRGKELYMAKATKIRKKEIRVRLYENGGKGRKVFEKVSKPFFMTRDTVIQYIEKKHFDKN